MLKGVTSTGFEFELAPMIADDLEFIELINQADRGDETVLPDLVLHTLGKDGKARLFEHCRKDGIVSAKAVSAEIVEIFKIAQERDVDVKN